MTEKVTVNVTCCNAAMQVLHELGYHFCDASGGRVHFPVHSSGDAQYCAGQWSGHAHAAVHHSHGWFCHHQALHPPLGGLVNLDTLHCHVLPNYPRVVW